MFLFIIRLLFLPCLAQRFSPQHYLLFFSTSCLVAVLTSLVLPSSLPRPSVVFFSLSRFWPRCRLWHHFVQISPIPPFHKSKCSRLLCWCSYRQTGRRATFENVSVLWPSLTAALIAETTIRCLVNELKLAFAMFSEQCCLCNMSSWAVCDKVTAWCLWLESISFSVLFVSS